MALQQNEQKDIPQIAKDLQIVSARFSLEITLQKPNLIITLKDKSTKKLFKSLFTSHELLSCGFNKSQAQNLETIQHFIQSAQKGENGLKLDISTIIDEANDSNDSAEYGQITVTKEDNFFGKVHYKLPLPEIPRDPIDVNTESIDEFKDDINLMKEQLSVLTTDLSAAKSLANEEREAIRASMIDLSKQDKVSMDQEIKMLQKEVAFLKQYQMPKGSVLSWYGPKERIPTGWEIYDDENEDEDDDKKEKMEVGSDRKNNVYVYESDFDEKGIIYAIGTNYGASEWQNPSETGLIEIQTATNMGRVSKGKEYLLNRNPGIDCYVNEKEYSWFMIDFKDVRIRPTDYTMRHITGPNNKNHLRHWQLQGSNDGLNWDCLNVHENDMSLNENDATFTWILEDIEEFYRYFRIKMTGQDSSSRWYLCCAGFEIYGEVRKEDEYDDLPKSMMTLIKIV